LLYTLLRRHWDVPDGTLRNVLRGNVRPENWISNLAWFERERASSLDEELEQTFYRELDQVPELRQQYDQVASTIGGRRKHLTSEMRQARDKLIGKLRRRLARSSLTALKPALIILDEFQRFKYLLDDKSDIGALAQELFGFQEARVLLLSATPYKMYTVQGEKDEDHYQDFYQTVRFLLEEKPETLQQLQSAVTLYRDTLLHLAQGRHRELQKAKESIEGLLRRVMVRTERLAVSADRNGMLVEHFVAQDQVHPSDLMGFVHLDKIANALDAGDQVEYWKSAAYPLNLMDRYKLKEKFTSALDGAKAPELNTLLRNAQDHLLSWQEIQAYQAIDPRNARLRALFQDSVETGSWQLLWMPPALPYYQTAGPFHDVQTEGCTKTLVFSAWKLVPKTISMLLSYEVERRMLGERERTLRYSELSDKRSALLRFSLNRGRLTGMPVFSLIYPCLTLAEQIDPFAIAHRTMNGTTPSWGAIFEAARRQVKTLLNRATASIRIKRGGREDERWYWAALALLDHHFCRQATDGWLSTEEPSLVWGNMLDVDSDREDRFSEHVHEFIDFFHKLPSLGPQPSDLVDVLTYVALNAPAVTTLRAMLRVVRPGEDDLCPAFLAAAAQVGLAFRTLFNQPDVISLLQHLYLEQVYWQKVLRYCSAGNLQAVMDEYVHVLYESLGLVGHDPVESVTKLSEAIQRALTLRAPTLRFDEIILGRDVESPKIVSRGIRCRYALRFGDEKTTDDEHTRGADVRIAFNSPFRPFVLATTSAGQEGLDFHQYCHRVVHWNLPSNPVDLEQREGRVHRYKGHVIRRNLATKYSLETVKVDKLVDPWRQIFEQAVRDRKKHSPHTNDLVPFWVYEMDSNDATDKAFKIERRVPVLPLSREISRMERLKQSLVVYRSVIGQPRQQELVKYLSTQLDGEEVVELVRNVAIDLSPPKR